MKLLKYLERRGESVRHFAARAGVKRTTINSILYNNANGCRIDIAWRIVTATRDEPAGRGGTVDWLDLIP